MLRRWDPFDEIDRLHKELLGGSALKKSAFPVSVDIREEDDAFVLDADVPGLKADQVNIGVERNVLTISGERKFGKEEESDKYRRLERYYGSFSRAFTLPDTVDADAIDANLVDGVLRVKLPKRDAPGARSIEVKPAA